jgi:hypothetical protein
MKTLPPFKRGDTFQLGCLAKDSDGQPENLDNVTLRAQARSALSGQLVAELAVGKTDQSTHPGEFAISAVSTDAWPLGVMLIDIEQRVGQAVASTETLKLTVIEDVTHD